MKGVIFINAVGQYAKVHVRKTNKVTVRLIDYTFELNQAEVFPDATLAIQQHPILATSLAVPATLTKTVIIGR